MPMGLICVTPGAQPAPVRLTAPRHNGSPLGLVLSPVIGLLLFC